MESRIAAIRRNEIYSPNHVSNDSLILNKTADVLKRLGYVIVFYKESSVVNDDVREKYIFSMARGPAVLRKLNDMEKAGAFIINSPVAALNTHRVSMVNMLNAAGIPFPRSVIINNNEAAVDYFETLGMKKLWLKRGDVHAEHREDVTLVYSMDELNSIIQEFHRRGISNAVVQEHLSGDTVKFYGLLGTDYFHWYYLNGENHIPFDQDYLKKTAFKSAETLKVDVFGGDAIVSPGGSLRIIDVNDWPSFAPVRDEAAEQIGRLIHKIVTGDGRR